MQYKVIKEMPFFKVGSEVEISNHINQSILLLGNINVIHASPANSKMLINDGWVQEIPKETMITIKGKKYSEDTIHEALKNHIG